jgi:hypothetical protein
MRIFAVPSLESGVIVGFKAGEGSIEHFPARHDHDIKSGGHFVATEQLARQALGAVAFDG